MHLRSPQNLLPIGSQENTISTTGASNIIKSNSDANTNHGTGIGDNINGIFRTDTKMTQNQYQNNTTDNNNNNNWPPFDWFELPRMDNLTDIFKLSCSTAVIFGGLIPYVPQYIKIKQCNDSDGFSTYGMYLRILYSLS